jgi:hypothetical protein
VADQRQLSKKASIADIAVKMVTNWQESARKLAYPHNVLAGTFMSFSQRSAALKEVGQVGDQTA